MSESDSEISEDRAIRVAQLARDLLTWDDARKACERAIVLLEAWEKNQADQHSLPVMNLASAPYFPPAMFFAMADLSHWNQLPENAVAGFALARAYGVTKVGLKATQGISFIDPTFASRRAAAVVDGVGVCAYAFLDATTPASAQTDFFLSAITNSGSIAGIELAIDCESNAGAADGSVTIPIAAEVASRIADKVGFLPLFYSTRSGPDGKGGGFPNAVLSACPLWLAEWGSRPICPPGWTKWKIWQSTNGKTGSDPVAVPGLGAVDRSYIAAASLAEIDSWWGKRT